MCTPVCGPNTLSFYDSVLDIQTYYFNSEIDVDIIRTPRPFAADVARNGLVQHVLRGDYDYLWFVDQDAKLNPRTLERLLRWNKDIIGAFCVMQGDWTLPALFNGARGDGRHNIVTGEAAEYLNEYADITSNEPQILDNDEGLVELDFTGCHCLLIKREVLETIPHPWFADILGKEDKFFCLKAKKYGYKVFVDMSVIAGHIARDYSMGVKMFMADLLLRSEIERNGDDG
jgi:hypothetical protein